MKLKEYIRINKTDCPEGCKFKNKNDLSIVLVPPPVNPKILLISRDPTLDFLSLYEYSRHYNLQERRRVLFAAGIPRLLILQITRFLGRRDIKDFYRIFEIAYWTHFHKCPTDEKNKFTTICANRWLKKEINNAKVDRIQTIVCLGKDVENWVKSNIPNNIKIINLPHPSGRSHKWNNKDDAKILEAIKELLHVCRED